MKQEDTSEMPTAESCGCDTGPKLLRGGRLYDSVPGQ